MDEFAFCTVVLLRKFRDWKKLTKGRQPKKETEKEGNLQRENPVL
jgi:hypothetical protein